MQRGRRPFLAWDRSRPTPGEMLTPQQKDCWHPKGEERQAGSPNVLFLWEHVSPFTVTWSALMRPRAWDEDAPALPRLLKVNVKDRIPPPLSITPLLSCRQYIQAAASGAASHGPGRARDLKEQLHDWRSSACQQGPAQQRGRRAAGQRGAARTRQSPAAPGSVRRPKVRLTVFTARTWDVPGTARGRAPLKLAISRSPASRNDQTSCQPSMGCDLLFWMVKSAKRPPSRSLSGNGDGAGAGVAPGLGSSAVLPTRYVTETCRPRRECGVRYSIWDRRHALRCAGLGAAPGGPPLASKFPQVASAFPWVCCWRDRLCHTSPPSPRTLAGGSPVPAPRSRARSPAPSPVRRLMSTRTHRTAKSVKRVSCKRPMASPSKRPSPSVPRPRSGMARRSPGAHSSRLRPRK